MTAEEMLWEYGGDILRSPTMAHERTIPQHGSTTCYDHSVAVTLCSIWYEGRCSMIIFSTTGGSTTATTSFTASTMPGRRWKTRSGTSA